MTISINFGESFKTMIQKLLQCEFECGGYLNNDDKKIVSIEIFSGSENEVHYPQYKPCGDNRITFHTHPRNNLTANLKFVPPSPDDIICFTLANSYIYPNIKRTALVFANEGCYTLRIVKKMKPIGKELQLYLKEAFMILYSIWSFYNHSIWNDEQTLLHVFDLIQKCFGIEIKLYYWNDLKTLPLDVYDTKLENLQDFDRNVLSVQINLFKNLSETMVINYLNDYMASLKD